MGIVADVGVYMTNHNLEGGIMAYEASINFKSVHCNIFEFISALNNIGWGCYNESGFIEFLSLGDKGDYDWKSEPLSLEELYDLIKEKQHKNEIIGIDFFYKYEKYGFSLLVNDSAYVMNLCINRKTLADKQHSTDFGWYHKNIIIPLREYGIIFEYFSIDETNG